MTLTSTDVEQLVKDLDSKERFYLADRLLSTLTTTQLLSLIDQAERLIKHLKSEKQTSVLFDIRKINNSNYAYIKRLGQEYPNLYLGLMRFIKGKTYKITHKLTDTEFVVRGLGLEQEGLKTYLKIEFLQPEEGIRKYLFYDASLEVPRLPQQIDIEKFNENITSTEEQAGIFRIEQGILESNKFKNTITPRKDWSAIFIKKDWIVEEIKEEQTNAPPKIKPTEYVRPIEKEPIKSVRPVTKFSKQNIPQEGQPSIAEQATVQVGKSFVAGVEKSLQQWVKFSQMIPGNYSWQLSDDTKQIVLRDSSNEKVIVVYNRNSRRLSANSPRLLHTMLVTIVSKVSTNKLVPISQQSLAQKWLLNLQNPPLQDEKVLLAFLFNL